MSKPVSAGYLLYTQSSNKRSIRFNMRHLLSLVHEQPILWLVSHANYRSSKQRQKAWYEIARALDKEFEQLEKNEQKRIVLAIIKRWKNVRDTFFNALRNNRTRPYIYEQELKFLLSVRSDLHRKHVAKKTEVKTNTSESDGNVSEQKYRREIALADPLIESDEEATTSSTDSDVATSSHQNDSSAHYFGLSAQQEASMRQDQSFFDSIKPTVRTLSEERKFDFRIEVMRLLKRIKARQNEASD